MYIPGLGDVSSPETYKSASQEYHKTSGYLPPGYQTSDPRMTEIRNAWQGVGGNESNYTTTGLAAFGADVGKAYDAGYFNQSPGGGVSLSSGGSSGGWGGGWGGGGGGGGGGAPTMTQAQFDAMLGLISTPTQGLDLQTMNLPAFRGVPIRPFQGQLYNRMQRRLRRGVQGDRRTINTTTQQLRNQLRNSYTNPYASAKFAVNPVMQTQMQGLMAGTGANPVANSYAESVNAENAYGQSSDAAFSNLMNVLGAANQQEQQSRMAQVGMDRAEALRRLGAERLGLSTGIDLARGKAKEAWQVRADDRRYQNAMTRQQWRREEMMRNQDVRNLERQTEYQTGTETRESRLQALLDLIGSTTGTKIDTSAIQKLIAQWGGTPTPPEEEAAKKGGKKKGGGGGGKHGGGNKGGG